MNKLQSATFVLAKASDGSPVIAIAIVMLFYIMFSVLEVAVEELLFGERFQH